MRGILICLVFGLSFAAERGVVRRHHDDQRAAFVKMETMQSQSETVADAQSARRYLQQSRKRYGLESGLKDLSLARVQHSLLGTHYAFAQSLKGIPVYGAEIILSVDRDGLPFMVYNNTYPTHELDKRVSGQPRLDRDQVMDLAWNDLRVHGTLIQVPSTQLVYWPEDGRFRLVYLVQISTHAPYGHWEHRIDAVTGDILEVRETAIARNPIPATYGEYDGPIWDRGETTRSFLAQQVEKQSGKRASGSATLFDPDPVTTLQDSSLRDTSPASAFTSAYFNRTLQDITQSGGTFSLVGPWVQIAEIEAPTNAPSTTTNGQWTATRGDNAFNDAMSYFHVDQSQRYIQSLGFSGATGIQFGSIRVDSDGAGGADNSFFSPSGNYLVFGHGCVDDNEDAFVILHEYGHALHASINPNWFGGDTGGMGEGFGDYWAGSYKLSTPNGSFNPEWAFPWDGHNNCWGGRQMDQTSYQYDPAASYGAHEFVGGVYSDELWSTPLFQSLLSLRQMGVPREEVDRVILQSHFGLGANLKIPDLAQATVNAAQMLYPNGPHAGVFHQKFMVHNIQTTLNNEPPGSTARSLVYAWISNNSQFESILVVDNYGSSSASLSLTAQRSTGPAATATRTVPARGFLREKASSLFPSLGSGSGYTVKVDSDAQSVRGGWVTNNLEAASGKSPSQGVAVSIPSDSQNPGPGVGKTLLFSYLPITDGLTSAPVIVNLGASNTNVTMRYYNQQGSLIATDSSTLSNLAPLRPFAAVANNLVPTGSGDVYMVAESSSQLITGVGFVFNNFSEPAIGNAAAIADFESGGTTGGNNSELQSGVPVSGLSGSTGGMKFFTIAIPGGTSNLNISLSGGSGDADIFVKFGSQPTLNSADFISEAFGNEESLSIPSPATGTWHLMLYGFSDYSGATLTATW